MEEDAREVERAGNNDQHTRENEVDCEVEGWRAKPNTLQIGHIFCNLADTTIILRKGKGEHIVIVSTARSKCIFPKEQRQYCLLCL